MQHKVTEKATWFIADGYANDIAATLRELNNQPTVLAVYIISDRDEIVSGYNMPVERISTNGFTSSQTVKLITQKSTTSIFFIYNQPHPLQLGYLALERMTKATIDSGCGMLFANHFRAKNDGLINYPLADYQKGSVRDDFDFGALTVYATQAFKDAAETLSTHFLHASFYYQRLRISQTHEIIRLPEYLYTIKETDTRASGQKIFDYVNPRNREVQIEMEKAFTQYLKEINAWLPQVENKTISTDERFEIKASVIIPVKNRVKTIQDAIESVLSQKTSFAFNILIVDNHSTDGTSELITKYAATNKQVVHHVPNRNDLGIGGCWNQAIFHEQCGKFVIQLDSDDLYINDNVIQTIVDKFEDEQCAMVIGSYEMVDFKLSPIPPGLIDHKEWTPENGHNNALRINGLGAPRAFYTPTIRSITFPNVSYGEDYAVALAICRNYKIGRIYEPLYLCRRWEDNSDASLDVEKMNDHNTYKDRVRTLEIMARQKTINNLQV